jgi:hypothetical protein
LLNRSGIAIALDSARTRRRCSVDRRIKAVAWSALDSTLEEQLVAEPRWQRNSSRIENFPESVNAVR